ncbi:MAG: protein kinase [Bacteroidota bacterium]
MIGKTISHYTILEKLGEGGMGVVYKAIDTKLDRFVALKFLPSHTADTEEGNQRLMQEAKAASSINHPTVCVIYDFEEADGKQFIAMEYVEGMTLRQRMALTPLSLDEIIDVTINIIAALKEAHNKGIVHRDIKPDNIMITNQHQVKVMDFGLAKLKDSIFKTRKSVRVGTLAYLAPEQILGKEINSQTDIFALGVVLYEMTTRRLPFRGEHEAAVMYSILHEECTPVHRYAPDVPTEFVLIIERALKKESRDRFQSAGEMEIQLRQYWKKQSSGSIAPSASASNLPSAQKRRLSAIVFTDMVGYSALAQKNESLSLELLAQQQVIVRSVVPNFSGKEIDTIGDAFFLEFESALEASRCAVEIQKSIREHNGSMAPEKQIHIRIGIHIGDVIHIDNKVQGDGVNIAARIEPIADSGGICVSEDVARQIRNKIDLPLLKIGRPQLKNIQIPVDIYKIVLPWEKQRSGITERMLFTYRRKKIQAIGIALLIVVSSVVTFLLWQNNDPVLSANISAVRDTSGTTVHSTIDNITQTPVMSNASTNSQKEENISPGSIHMPLNNTSSQTEMLRDTAPTDVVRELMIPSNDYRIAVLPFSNISPNKEDEYFADGMTEELISTLSKIQQIRVIARTSIIQYRGSNKKISEIGNELKVKAILTGSVRKSGKKLRITVQLIDVSNQEHLWSEEYNSELTDVFDIQSNVAKRVANALPLKLIAPINQNADSRRQVNIEAYTLYLQGRFYWNKRFPLDLLQSVEYFKKSIQKDSQFSLAYAGLADAYVLLGNFYVLPPPEAYPLAKKAALKALELDASLPEAHTSLGFTLMHYDWNWSEAEKEFRTSLELNPSYAMGQSWYAYFLTVTGRFDEAVAARKHAQELDPLSIVISSEIGLTLYFSGKFQEAIDQYQTVLRSDPSFYAAYIPLGGALLQQKRYDEAIVAFKKARIYSLNHPIPTAALAYAYAVSGKRKESRTIAEELKKNSVKTYISPYWIGIIYAGLGENETAFQWMKKGIDQHDGSMILLKVEPILGTLRNDKRYTELLTNIGLN